MVEFIYENGTSELPDYLEERLISVGASLFETFEDEIYINETTNGHMVRFTGVDRESGLNVTYLGVIKIPPAAIHTVDIDFKISFNNEV